MFIEMKPQLIKLSLFFKGEDYQKIMVVVRMQDWSCRIKLVFPVVLGGSPKPQRGRVSLPPMRWAKRSWELSPLQVSDNTPVSSGFWQDVSVLDVAAVDIWVCSQLFMLVLPPEEIFICRIEILQWLCNIDCRVEDTGIKRLDLKVHLKVVALVLLHAMQIEVVYSTNIPWTRLIQPSVCGPNAAL